MLRIGTAGWSVPGEVRDRFAGDGSQLERYATRLTAAEINSSFHRPHRRATYERWAAAVPEEFAFAVKAPKTLSHIAGPAEPATIAQFAAEVAGLGSKLRAILVQFPPKRAFSDDAANLLTRLGDACAVPVVCEPRHGSWADAPATDMLAANQVARVAADPSRIAGGEHPGGWPGLRYWRLHGSPRVYYSAYEAEALARLADAIAAELAQGRECWCIFDNTASGAATANALDLGAMLAERKPS